MFKAVSAGLLTVVLALAPVAPHEAVDNEINARIRKEGEQHSHIQLPVASCQSPLASHR
jgi:hypothetical protein